MSKINHPSRADDSFMRKAIGGLGIFILTSGIGGIYAAGKLVDRVDSQQLQISEIKSDVKSLKTFHIEIAKSLGSIQTGVLSLDTKSDNLTHMVDRANANIRAIKQVQDRNFKSITNSEKHIQDRDRHK